MKHIFTRLFLTCMVAGNLLSGTAQNVVSTIKDIKSPSNADVKEAQSLKLNSNLFLTETNENSGAKTAMAACTDMIKYTGSTNSGGFQVGGHFGFQGVWQVFPSYVGTVIGVEFMVENFNGTTPTGNIVITNANSGGFPGNTNAGPAMTVFMGNPGVSTYTVMFPTPISVTAGYGFGIGFYVNSQFTDSVKFQRGPAFTSAGVPDYGFLTLYTTTSYTSTSTFFNNGNDINFLFHPIISTSVNPTWVSAKTSTTCGAPAVYNFSNTTAPSSTYITNPVINPGGVTNSLDYGDGSPAINYTSTPVTYTYTNLGNYNAQYTKTYIGWTSNCPEIKTIPIVVDNPHPSFSYTTSGLTITLNNSSQNLSNFVWNFGDLTTSTLQQPGIHTFSSPGTYVIELEATAACGKVRYSVSVTVPSDVIGGETGIYQYSSGTRKLSIFPNPAGNFLQLEYEGTTEQVSKIEIYNSIGTTLRVIKPDFNNESIKMDISDLSKGIYFIKIKTSEGDVVKSFIKE